MEHSSYEAFGAAFFTRAVTAERVASTVSRVAGSHINVGPLKVGPGGLAEASAVGTVKTIAARQVATHPIKHEVTIPVSLALEVVLAGQNHSFSGELTLTLRIAALAVLEPLQIVIDIEPLTAADVSVKTRASGLQGRILQRVGNMDEEIRDQVLRVVGNLLESPDAQAVRVINVGDMIDDVWK